MFVEGAAMLIRWKQGTQKVKANFDNAAKTRAGIAQPGTAKRGRERELPRHPSTSQVSVRFQQAAFDSGNYPTAAFTKGLCPCQVQTSAPGSQSFAPRMLRL